MIQEITPYKYDNTYELDKVQNNDYVLIFNNNEVVMKKSRTNIVLPKFEDVNSITNISSDDFIYLFRIDDYKFFLFRTKEDKNYVDNILVEDKEDILVRESTAIFRKLQPSWMAFAGVTAKHLNQWYSSNKYCGRCGHELEIYSKERALHCSECNNIIYPTISPAITVGIVNKDKILLTKYSRGPIKKYNLVAGFVEIGEALEDTVRRECMEEVGLKVKNIRYFASQPWGLTNIVMVGFFADVDGDDDIILEDGELKEGKWFKYDEVPEPESLISLTDTMINEFKNKKGDV